MHTGCPEDKENYLYDLLLEFKSFAEATSAKD